MCLILVDVVEMWCSVFMVISFLFILLIRNLLLVVR